MNGFNDNVDMNNNDEQQSEGGINVNNDTVYDEFGDNNNEHIISDIKVNNYHETVEQVQWMLSVNRHDATKDVLATSMINMDNDVKNPNTNNS